MDGSDRELVELGHGGRECASLVGIKSVGQSKGQRLRNTVREQLLDIAMHARLKRACGKLGEGDRGDRAGLDTTREQHGHAPSHQGRLAGAGGGLDQ